MTDLSNALSLLLVEDHSVVTAVLRGEQSPPKDKTVELLAQLKQLSSSKKDSTNLFKIYKENKHAFLNGLRSLGNLNGSVLVQVLAKSEADTLDETASLTQEIAENAMEYAQKDTIEFYLQLYVAITGAYGLGNVNDCVRFWSLLNEFVTTRDVQSIVLVITLKYIELNKKEVHQLFDKFLGELSAAPSTQSYGYSQLDNLIVSMACFFPIFPDIVIPTYTSESTKDAILGQILKIKQEENLMKYLNEVLRLLNASQISEECRSFNLKHYYETLLQGWKMQNPLINVQSAVCLAKLYNLIQLDKSKLEQISLDSLCQTLTSYICEQNSNLNIAIEGLAYITLSKAHRRRIRDDVDVIDKLVDILRISASSDHSLCFGVLTIFTHLSFISSGDQTSKQTTINDLKNFASPSGIKDQGTKENIDEIFLFNKDLVLNYNIVSIINQLDMFSNAVLSKTYSQSTKDLAITFLKQLATSREKSVKETIAKNGGVDIIMDYLVSSSELDKESLKIRPKNVPELFVHYYDGCRALAKILIVVDPVSVFKKYEARNAVPFVAELVHENSHQWNPEKSTNNSVVHVTSLDKFEGLMALTNLATADAATRTLIIKMTFEPYVDNLLLAENLQIRKGAIELVSNLIVEPTLLVKFFNIEGNKSNYDRLDLLIKLLDSEDDSIQVAVAGLLVNACEVSEMIGGILLSDKQIRSNLLESIISILQNQANEQDLVLRVLYLVQDVVYLALSQSEDNATFLKSNNSLQTALSTAAKINKNNREIVGVIVQVLRMLKD